MNILTFCRELELSHGAYLNCALDSSSSSRVELPHILPRNRTPFWRVCTFCFGIQLSRGASSHFASKSSSHVERTSVLCTYGELLLRQPRTPFCNASTMLSNLVYMCARSYMHMFCTWGTEPTQPPPPTPFCKASRTPRNSIEGYVPILVSDPRLCCTKEVVANPPPPCAYKIELLCGVCPHWRHNRAIASHFETQSRSGVGPSRI